MTCPYCTAERETVTGLYTHVLDEHADAVIAHWIDEHGISARRSGQRTLAGYEPTARRAVADD